MTSRIPDRVIVASGLVTIGLLVAGGLWIPSRSQVLAQTLTPGRDLPSIGLPRVGTRLIIPSRDLFGQPITVEKHQTIIAMPSCQSCLIKRIDLDELKSMATTTVILAFPEQPPTEWKAKLKSPKFRVLLDAQQKVLPGSAYVFAPTTIIADAKGTITKSFSTIGGKESDR